MIITGARTTGLVESPLLSNGHGGFGKRPGETGRSKDWHRASGRLRGGKDNFAVDREAAAKALSVVPHGRHIARSNRNFLTRAVRLMAERGISQFIDLASRI